LSSSIGTGDSFHSFNLSDRDLSIGNQTHEVSNGSSQINSKSLSSMGSLTMKGLQDVKKNIQKGLDFPKRKYDALIRKLDNQLSKFDNNPVCKYLTTPIIRSIAFSATSPIAIVSNLLAGISHPRSAAKNMKDAVLGGTVQKTIITVAPQMIGTIVGLSLLTSTPVTWPIIVAVAAIGLIATAYDASKVYKECKSKGYSFESTMIQVKDNFLENVGKATSAFAVGMFWSVAGLTIPGGVAPVKDILNESKNGNTATKLVEKFEEQKACLKSEIAVSIDINVMENSVIEGNVKGFVKKQKNAAISTTVAYEKAKRKLKQEVKTLSDKFNIKSLTDEEYIASMRQNYQQQRIIKP
jgi:hypothetical protein